MYIHVSISFNPRQRTSFVYAHLHQMEIIYGHVSICAFDLSTIAWVHVHRQLFLVENNLNVCTQVSIGFNASHHHVCTSTTACMSKHIYYKVSCVHVYMYIHSFIPFDPCMCLHVNRQQKPYAVSTITSILAVTIHIACIGMYIYVSISFNPSQHTSFVCAHLHQSQINYGHLRTCQHLCLPPFNYCMGTCQSSTLCLVENNLNVCTHVSIGFNASHHHVCTSTTTCMSKHIDYKVSVLRPCLHVRTFLRSLHVYMSIVNQSPMRCRNISCNNSHRLYWHIYTCQHQLQPKSTSFVYVYAHLQLKSSMDIYVHVSICAFHLSMHGYMSIVNTIPCRK